MTVDSWAERMETEKAENKAEVSFSEKESFCKTKESVGERPGL